MLIEEWKDIPDYEGMYQISNFGRVKSLQRVLPHKKYGTWTIKERILKPGWVGVKSNQYQIVFLHKGKGEQHCFRIHRLVAENFIPRIDGKNVVNHIDCDRSNNRVDNLEWVTDKENAVHAWNHGRCDNVGWPSSPVVNVETGERFKSIKAACDKYGVTTRAIYQAAKNPNRRCCGYHWKYENEREAI